MKLGEVLSMGVSKLASAWVPTAEDLALPGMEPVFLLGEGHELHVPEWFGAGRMESHFAHSLLRNPQDLTCHVRRVLFWLERPGCEGLAAALADLSVVLDGRGEALWQRLFQQSRHRLPEALSARLADRKLAPPESLEHALFSANPPYPLAHMP
jgi:hypothetical protein